MNEYEVNPDSVVHAPEAKPAATRKPAMKPAPNYTGRKVAVEAEEPKKLQPKYNLKYMRDKMREPVRGIFKFDEAPGQTLHFNYREFREDPIEQYSLKDGSVCTLPLGVAKHINKNMWYSVHEHCQDEYGQPNTRIGHRVQRASFQSLEFVDIDDFEPAAKSGLVTVERI